MKPRILSYELSTNEVRDVEINLPDGSPGFTIRARRMQDKILVETIADRNGQIAAASDIVKEAKLTVDEIKRAIRASFKSD